MNAAMFRFAMHIVEGDSDGVRLDGLNAVLVVDSPAVMGAGGWRVAIYLDERADDQQRAALGRCCPVRRADRRKCWPA